MSGESITVLIKKPLLIDAVFQQINGVDVSTRSQPEILEVFKTAKCQSFVVEMILGNLIQPESPEKCMSLDSGICENSDRQINDCKTVSMTKATQTEWTFAAESPTALIMSSPSPRSSDISLPPPPSTPKAASESSIVQTASSTNKSNQSQNSGSQNSRHSSRLKSPRKDSSHQVTVIVEQHVTSPEPHYEVIMDDSDEDEMNRNEVVKGVKNVKESVKDVKEVVKNGNLKNNGYKETHHDSKDWIFLGIV